MKLRSYILLFSLVIFVLAAVGMIIYYTGRVDVVTFWLTIGLIVAYPCTFAIFVPLLAGDGKLSGKKVLLVTFSITTVSIAVSSSVWTIITPKWSFSVTTDRSAYGVGENVESTVSLKNMGFITHSFKSRTTGPVVISVEYQYPEDPSSRTQVWYSPFQENITEFSVGPNLFLERHFTWNQTKSVNIWSGEEIEPGTYWIIAFIPSDWHWRVGALGIYNHFEAWTSINITSS